MATRERHESTFALPFPSPRLCQIARDVLAVDPEARKEVHRELTQDGSTLLVTLEAPDARFLRVSQRGLLESVVSVLETMDQFDPPSDPCAGRSNHK